MNNSKHNTIDFKPAWWLRNRHLQTLYPVFIRKKIQLNLLREEFTLTDGDIIFLDWTVNKLENKPVIVFLHGLEGSTDSPYIRGIMKESVNQGFRSVCLHFRGCATNTNNIISLSKSYHAGETEDLSCFIHYLLQNIKQNTQIFMVGYSLGANVLLKWLGENPNQPRISAAVAVSTPFDLSQSTEKLKRGFSRVYNWWLLKSLRQSMLNKFLNKSEFLNYSELNKIKSIEEFDNKITAPMHGFSSAKDYYAKSSSKKYLRQIKIPTLIISAKDDPFLPQEAIPNLSEVSSCVDLQISPHGGHVGFIEGKIPFYASYYLEWRILQYLSEFLSKV